MSTHVVLRSPASAALLVDLAATHGLSAADALRGTPLTRPELDDLDAEVSDHLTVAEMAEHLGYSQASSFTQAFRRWKGIGPREYRQKALEQ